MRRFLLSFVPLDAIPSDSTSEIFRMPINFGVPDPDLRLATSVAIGKECKIAAIGDARREASRSLYSAELAPSILPVSTFHDVDLPAFPLAWNACTKRRLGFGGAIVRTWITV